MSAEIFGPAEQAADDGLLQALGARWMQIAASGGAFTFRPAFEAHELRRMIRAGAGGMPPDLLTRMWRCLHGDALVASGLKAVYAGGGNAAQSLEGARGYFGFGANVVVTPEVREVLERVGDAADTLGCLPWPENAGPGQWWPMLNEGRFRDLSIMGAWPNLPSNPTATPRVAIVSRGAIESSGEDDMLATGHDDAHQAVRRLAEARIEGEVVARARSLALMRIKGFLDPDDLRLEAARRAGLEGFRIVGVLPRP
jgi:hypothetical protein